MQSLARKHSILRTKSDLEVTCVTAQTDLHLTKARSLWAEPSDSIVLTRFASLNAANIADSFALFSACLKPAVSASVKITARAHIVSLVVLRKPLAIELLLFVIALNSKDLPVLTFLQRALALSSEPLAA